MVKLGTSSLIIEVSLRTLYIATGKRGLWVEWQEHNTGRLHRERDAYGSTAITWGRLYVVYDRDTGARQRAGEIAEAAD